MSLHRYKRYTLFGIWEHNTDFRMSESNKP